MGENFVPVTKIKGIGPRLARRLNKLGISSARDLMNVNVSSLSYDLGIPEDRVRSWMNESREIVARSERPFEKPHPPKPQGSLLDDEDIAELERLASMEPRREEGIDEEVAEAPAEVEDELEDISGILESIMSPGMDTERTGPATREALPEGTLEGVVTGPGELPLEGESEEITGGLGGTPGEEVPRPEEMVPAPEAELEGAPIELEGEVPSPIGEALLIPADETLQPEGVESELPREEILEAPVDTGGGAPHPEFEEGEIESALRELESLSAAEVGEAVPAAETPAEGGAEDELARALSGLQVEGAEREEAPPAPEVPTVEGEAVPARAEGGEGEDLDKLLEDLYSSRVDENISSAIASDITAVPESNRIEDAEVEADTILSDDQLDGLLNMLEEAPPGEVPTEVPGEPEVQVGLMEDSEAVISGLMEAEEKPVEVVEVGEEKQPRLEDIYHPMDVARIEEMLGAVGSLQRREKLKNKIASRQMTMDEIESLIAGVGPLDRIKGFSLGLWRAVRGFDFKSLSPAKILETISVGAKGVAAALKGLMREKKVEAPPEVVPKAVREKPKRIVSRLRIVMKRASLLARVATAVLVLALLGYLVYRFAIAGMISEYHLRRGLAYVAEGKYDRANAEFDATIRGKKGVRAYNDFGEAYMNAGKYKMAEDKFKGALKLDINDYRARLNLGLAQARSGDFAEAIGNLELLRKRYPNDPAVYRNLGIAHFLSGSPEDLERADDALTRAIRLNTGDLDSHNLLAQVYIKRGILDEKRREDFLNSAEDEAEIVLQYDPQNSDALANMVRISIARGDKLAALKQYEKMRELSPGKLLDSSTHRSLGRIYADREELEMAAQEYGRAIMAASPSDDLGTAYYEQGTVYGRMGRKDEAVRAFQNSKRQNPNYTPVYVALGNLYLSDNLLPQAEEEFATAVKLDKNEGEGYYGLGNVMYKLDRPDRAMDYYLKAAELGVNTPQLRYNLGRLWYNEGKYSNALREWQKARDMAPRNPQIYYSLGNAYAKLGDWDNARKQYVEAVRLNDKDGEAYNNLGASYEHLGRTRTAILNYWKAVANLDQWQHPEKRIPPAEHSEIARSNLNRLIDGRGIGRSIRIYDDVDKTLRY
ncbi:MAG: tetratricopeptide repeat protein [bacterium]